MVDCNQGWRMPWDVRPAWDVERATEVAVALEAEGVYWIEEPLHRGDVAGMAELRRRVDIRVAGGELTREPYEFAALLAADSLDVYQPDCVCTQGITGLRRLAADVVAAGKVFTPHTWGNGIGLLANAHLTAGTVDAPFLEFPFDPPEWTTARRDFPLTEHRRGRRRRLAAPRRPPRPRHHPRRTDARPDPHLGHDLHLIQSSTCCHREYVVRACPHHVLGRHHVLDWISGRAGGGGG